MDSRSLLSVRTAIIVLAAFVTLAIAALAILTQREQNLLNSVRASVLAQCERGNVTRPQLVQSYLDISHGNHQRAIAYRRAVTKGAPQGLIRLIVEQARANETESMRLRHDAAVVANAQNAVSANPDAGLVKRSIIDCTEANR